MMKASWLATVLLEALCGATYDEIAAGAPHTSRRWSFYGPSDLIAFANMHGSNNAGSEGRWQ